MKTLTKNGISTTTQLGEENFARFTHRRKSFIQYDYRHTNGKLFSCVGPSIEVCRAKKREWINEQARELSFSSLPINDDRPTKGLARIDTERAEDEPICRYAGEELVYYMTFSEMDHGERTLDYAQNVLDHVRVCGFQSCCVHVWEQHHVYVSREFIERHDKK